LNDASAPTASAPAPLITKVKSPAQVLLCKGCCCGKTDRGLPEVPVDRIKAAWKSEKLNRGVQLTISGCLGPCDLPNVAVVVTAHAATWYGRLDGDAHYDALITWARACVAAGAALPPPEELAAHRFDRFDGQ
jgi:cobaltochelatase CobN